jgi:ParB-like chromosome segregation protein Spo0J
MRGQHKASEIETTIPFGHTHEEADASTRIKVSEIHVPRRIRQHLGDIESLMANVEDVGLLHPLPVRRDGKRVVLVAGARRLEACRRLGWGIVPVHFVRPGDLL